MVAAELPEFLRDFDWIDCGSCPPGHFVAKAMVVPMMNSAQRNSEFIAGL